MPPKRRQKQPQLEDSWEDGDQSDDQASSESDGILEGQEIHDDPDFEIESSQEQASSPILPKNASPSPRLSQSSQSAIRERGSRRTSQPNNNRVTGPDFIFPSIHEEDLSNPWSASRQLHTPQSDQRRRRMATRAQPSPRGNASAGPPSSASNVADMLFLYLGHITKWGLEVAGGAMGALKAPISLALAVYLFIGLLVVVQNAVSSSLSTALSPLCRIPGVSYLPIPVCHGIPSKPNQDIPTPTHPIDREFSDLLKLSTKFDDVLAQAADGASLPFHMKRSEASIRDLRQVVKFSHLRSKNELSLEFDSFIETARIASMDLQRFNSHVGRAVDSLLSSARWISRILDDATHRNEPRGLIPTFIKSTVLAPFQPLSLSYTESILLDQYLSYTSTISMEIHRLIAEAQALLFVLQSLEDRLDTIHGIAVRDSVTTQASKDEVLATLWAALGGRRGDLRRYDTHLELLTQVSRFREVAFAHVTGTILKLQEMQSELEGLGERVRSAELIGERMPLSVHLEEVKLGIERLERARFEGRKIEGQQMRRAVDGDGGGIAEEPLRWNGGERSIGG